MHRLAGAAVALAALVLAPAAGAKEDAISVGLVISLSQSPYYLAREKGYFAEEGVAPDTGTFRGGQSMVSSLATGDLDVGMGAISASYFNAVHQKLDLRAVAALAIDVAPVNATPALVLKDLWDSGAVRSGKDLRGRKVAVNAPGSIVEYHLTIILGRYGMTLKDVDETIIGFPEQLVAFANKAIDVGFLAEPFATTAIRQGSTVLLEPEAGINAGDLTTVMFFSGRFLRERPDVGYRFLRAMLRGAKLAQGAYNKDPAVAAVIARATGIKQDAIENSVPFAYDPDLDIAKFADNLAKQEQVHRANGRLNYAEPVSMNDAIDATLVHKAAASLK